MTNVAANLIGGATVSFGHLIDYMEDHQEKYTLINTQYFLQGIQRYLNPLYVLLQILKNVATVDVVFLNSSRGGTKYLSPLLFVLAKVFRLKFVFRPFGGNIKDYTAQYNGFQKWIFQNTTLRADLFFLQTKELMQFYATQAKNTMQLPTSREEPVEKLLRGTLPFSKRFVYLGYVNEAKGIDHVLEAANQLGADYTIHIYGPIKEEKYKEKFATEKINYQGVLAKEEVLKTLKEYDVLLLPTFYQGEGYPGAIIEAYSLGLPVITTQWKAIPEIVQDGKTGFLIEPQSTAALVAAIRHFSVDNYSRYSEEARRFFLETFSVTKVTGRAIDQIKKLFEVS